MEQIFQEKLRDQLVLLQVEPPLGLIQSKDRLWAKRGLRRSWSIANLEGPAMSPLCSGQKQESITWFFGLADGKALVSDRELVIWYGGIRIAAQWKSGFLFDFKPTEALKIGSGITNPEKRWLFLWITEDIPFSSSARWLTSWMAGTESIHCYIFSRAWLTTSCQISPYEKGNYGVVA